MQTNHAVLAVVVVTVLFASYIFLGPGSAPRDPAEPSKRFQTEVVIMESSAGVRGGALAPQAVSAGAPSAGAAAASPPAKAPTSPLLCRHAATSKRAETWDWHKELGIPGTGAVSFMELISALVPENKRGKFAINVGARDGKDHDPVFPLLQNFGYGALAFEGDGSVLAALQQNMAAVNTSKNVHVIPNFVSSTSIVADLARFKVPQDFDVLKIDIDSIDMAIAKAVLDAGYRPKFLMMEINSDILPPFQWYLEESPAFSFKSDRVFNGGMYGVSGDALYYYLAPLGYRLVELELFDPASPCPRCEHNMWFVREDLLAGRPNLPPAPTYDEYVTIFWARQPTCLHINSAYCTITQISALLPGLRGDHASLQLLTPQRRALAYRILGSLAWNMEVLCPNCNMHVQLSEVPLCAT